MAFCLPRYKHILVAFTIIFGVFGVKRVIGSQSRKPCMYECVKLDTSIKHYVSPDADIRCILHENQFGCTISLSDFYEKLSILHNSNVTQPKNELTLNLKINCVDNEIHFTSSSEIEENEIQIKVAALLELQSCTVFLNELQVFKKYGRIKTLSKFFDTTIYPDADCSSLADIISIINHIPCGFNKISSFDSATRFFWESCEQTLDEVVSLEIYGCFQQKCQVRQDLLQRTFPRLQVLKLNNVRLTRFPKTFPWTKIHIDLYSPKNASDDGIFSKLPFDSITKNISSIPRKIEISASDMNISDVNLDGDIQSIVIINSHLKRINENLFRHVTGLIVLDLSNNDLEEIDESAFQMQTNLTYLKLKKNKLKFLSMNVFNSLYNVMLIDLSFNEIRTLSQEHFKHLLILQALNLAFNKITQLPGDFLKDQIHSLQTLDLSWNPLEVIPINAFYSDKLQNILISHCNINSTVFYTFIKSLKYKTLLELLESFTDHDSRVKELYSSEWPFRAILDISFNQIQYIDTDITNITARRTYDQLIKSIYIIFTGNPIDCKCLTFNIKHSYIDWKCMYPSEMKGRLVTSIKDNEFYCQVNITNCPKLCTCYERVKAHTFIVDCKNINITTWPDTMPVGELELWFRNSSLMNITVHEYFKNVTVLDGSHNRINVITSTAAIALTNLTSLKLDHNNLTSLPDEIMSTNIRTLTLAHNPFLCDCRIRWMKTWLLKGRSPVTDWTAIECTYNTSKVNQMVSLSDSFFVCRSWSIVSMSENVTFLIIVIGCFLFLLVSLSLLIYFQRFTIKVLLFMHFGIHSFDEQNHNDANMEYDAFVLYSQSDSAFVSKNIIETLIKKGYTVCDLYEDLVIGFTFLNNIEHMVKKSRKIIFSMTEDTLTNTLLMSAWNIAYEKSIDNFTDSIILVLDNEIKSKCEEDKVRKYIRSGKYIKKKSNILQSSILYFMPKHVNIVNDSNLNMVNTDKTAIPMIIERNNLNSSLVYISHSEEHDKEMRNTFIPELQVKNYDVRIFENAFIPGTDIRDEINEKLEDSEHFIFILSHDTIQDEVKMFILSTIISKSVFSNDNYLLLFTSGFIDYSCLPKEIEYYLNKYVTASISCPEFKGRLLKALSFIIGAILGLAIGQEHRKPCMYTVNGFDSSLTYNNSLDEEIEYVLAENQSECEINLSGLYTNLSTLHNSYNSSFRLDRKELFISLRIYCDAKGYNDIHLNSSLEQSKNQSKVQVAVQIVLRSCSLFVNELQIFKNHGRIWSIIHTNSSIIHPDSDCSSLAELQILNSRLPCDTNNRSSAIRATRFFWEFCSKPFEKVFDLLLEDLVIGFTFLDNIEHMVKKSRKIIFLVTEDTLTNNMLMSAWNIAYEKAIDNFTDAIILVLDNEIKSKCEDDKLRKYIRSGKFIKMKSNLLQSSILYLMPKHVHNVNNSNLNIVDADDPAIPMIMKRNNFGYDINNSLVYISHPEEHDEEIRNTLFPELEVKNYDVRIFENAFIPGADIREEITETLEDSERFIFILSQETLEDELKMFILSTVISKSVLSNNNFLLLFTSGFIDYSFLPKEIENYLNKYVTGIIACPEFKGPTSFKNYGRIWSILHHSNAIIHPDSDCSSLAELRNLNSRLPCDRNNRSPAIRASRFFWEFCSKPFEGVFDLMLRGCFYEHYEIKHDLLQHFFPKLQTLNLKYVNFAKSLVTYPWTNVYIDTPDAKLISYLSSSYESVLKNASSLPRLLIIRSSDVNISNVKFIGDISIITLNNIRLKSLNDNTFRNVSGLTRLDLSDNELETINQNVFKMLTNLESLNLGMNKLTGLHPGVFNWLHNLLILDLSRNKIKTLNQGQFKHLIKLEKVYLEYNEITELPDDFLKGQIHSLRILTLSWNPLENIPVYPLYAEGVTRIFVSHCKINSSGFQTLIESLSQNDLHSAHDDKAVRTGSEFIWPFQPRTILQPRATLDLSFNQIRTIENVVTSGPLILKFDSLLYFFHVSLYRNPIDCTCMSVMPYLTSYINEYVVKSGNSRRSITWLCMYPLELKRTLVSTVSINETYCPITVENCPERCSCFQRVTRQTANGHNNYSSTTIVDCRNLNITRLPETMSTGKLELWFQNTSLTQLTARDYFRNTTVLDASKNRINVIKSTAVIAMTSLTSLKLDHNNLTSLPVQIMSTNIRTLTLSNNPFICDCHIRWMKSWLNESTTPVTDWNKIECTYNTSQVNQMVSLSDSFFVCHSVSTISISEHIIFPSFVTGYTLFLLVSISLIIYFQRFTIKVLLFTHFGIHPFDKQKHDDANMEYDAFVLYSQSDSAFVSKNIIETLTKKDYTVCDLYEDLVIGFTFLDNIEHMVKKSRKIIFSMTEDTLSNDMLMSAWNIAYEKGIENFTDSIILVLVNEIKSTCEDDKLKKYIRSGKFIKKKSNLLQSSILYLMPTHVHIVNNSNLNIVDADDPAIPMIMERNNFGYDINSSLVYISHPEEHDEEIRNTIFPELEVKNYDVRIFENAFIPGTDIRDEITEKLEDSEHFIFILSQETLLDRVKMFILSTVISKSVLSNDNYLLLFTSGFIDYSFLPKEIENYLNKYVTASIACPEFKGRLLKALGYRF
ncbi:uncharacterized protein LOC123564598 [Mercenaria mercenaria]|uniref:uncharacterized protein LOC123564598 n=1 Tax=Mercenaria mercenaria TaxID=6596 RepID=UPI00234E8EC6|nr:uncharacterized protein LOC123564598 [Mercenaria mercenaria]